MKRILSVLVCIVLGFSAVSSAQTTAPGSTKPVLPSSIGGKFIVYKTGSVSTIDAQKVPFIGTIFTERAVYSQEAALRDVSRITYNPRTGRIIMRDFLSPEERQTLISKKSIYRRCRGNIAEPPVSFQVKAVTNSETGLYFTDLWMVEQVTQACELLTVRHHSRDNSCETICDRWAKGRDEGMTNMRLTSSRDFAMRISKARRK
ncbi:MAG: hypothetical protein WBA51_07960 [Erythrobacter sp.]